MRVPGTNFAMSFEKSAWILLLEDNAEKRNIPGLYILLFFLDGPCRVDAVNIIEYLRMNPHYGTVEMVLIP